MASLYLFGQRVEQTEPQIDPQATEALLHLRGIQGATAVLVDGFEKTWRLPAVARASYGN